ncbi:Metallo-dependent phosphatase-like protein [Aspergillus lucknowensis]|uniref:Metallo-dependent phosphatase-like protein n=1 Tax=Aspergillus lucknowensis TaxID=176173 RepID=A0ABR4LYW0_9EURO
MAFGGKSGLDALLHRPEQESFWTRFRRSPVTVLARYIYDSRAVAETNARNVNRVRVVCISDTHNTRPVLPDGDILIHAGDLTQSGTRQELDEQISWLDSQPHRYKVVIAGNHELCLDSRFPAPRCNEDDPVSWKSLIYLQNSSTTLSFGHGRRLMVFGSPYTPKHGNWAFQYPRTNTAVWEEIGIPEDTDILITHGPPKAHLDLGRMGCLYLLSRLWKMRRRPVLHVFGHVHGGYGKEVVLWDAFQQAYESAMDCRSRWFNLARLAWLRLVRLLTGWSWDGQQRTVMVNAAAVGGVRDEKRREAICVDI